MPESSVSETLITHTTCPYCGVGCGIEVTVNNGDEISVRGDRSHPANLGRLCSKGAALGETLDLDDRLLVPHIDNKETSWDRALDHVASRLRAIIDKHGPDAIAFYVSGQLLTEDYYVANKLIKGFIGTANIDTNSRLCMSSSVAGHKRAFGSDTVPCSYTDLEAADLVILTGSNTAWCHPVLFQRLRQAKKKNPQLHIVVIDPRETDTCDIADLHLPIRSGSDVALFNGLLAFLERHHLLDSDFIEQNTEGFTSAIAQALKDSPSIESTAEQCDLSADLLKTFYDWFGSTKNTVTVYSQGVNQWSCGTDKVNAIINCHLATGRIGKPGQGPFSFTGQPNAMGGREVGGLANQLAAHMDFSPETINIVSEFWKAPKMATRAGLTAVDMFKAIEEGTIKAVWIMATNPAVSMPEASQVEHALKQCEFVVVSDCIKDTDTTRLADVLFPATAWGEKNGTVTNSERCISRQRAFLPEPGDARPDWWIITQVAHRLGYREAFNYTKPVEIYREHAELSGFKNEGKRDFDISALSIISDLEYQRFIPVQWPQSNHYKQPTASMFSDGRFFHPDQKARFITVESNINYTVVDKDYPLILNTGRVRDQWHTMTRTGKSARLSNHRSEPYVEVHPDDAIQYNLYEEQLATINSRFGNMLARVSIRKNQKKGNLFVPMHWNHRFASSGKVGPLVNAIVDPISSQPQFKHTPVNIKPLTIAWRGFILSRKTLHNLPFPYWVRIKRLNVMHYEIAGFDEVNNWNSLVRKIEPDDGDWVEFQDVANGYFRAAHITKNRLNSCFFITKDNALPDDQWLDSLFAETNISQQDRLSLLSGQPTIETHPTGKTICACFNVGLNTIVEAIQEQRLTTVEAIGEALQAGTNCGSCIPELDSILKDLSMTSN